MIQGEQIGPPEQPTWTSKPWGAVLEEWHLYTMENDDPDRQKEMSDLEGIRETAELVQSSDALRHAKYCSDRAAATRR